MKLSKRETLMLVVGFIVVSVAAYVFYFIMPQLDKQQNINTQLIANRSTLQIVTMKNNQMKQLKSQIASMAVELDSKTTNIPHGSNDAKILLYLKALAGQTKNDINIVFTDEPTTDGSFIRRAVTLECLTSYDKLSALLKELNKATLYNIVQVVSAQYQAAVEQNPSNPNDSIAPPGTTPLPTPTGPTYTLNAHIEVYFYAFPLQQGNLAQEPPLTPAIKDRQSELFPK